MEVGKALAAVGGGAYALKGTARVGQRIFGPTLDVVGAALAQYTEYRLRNVGRIMRHAERALGTRVEEPGTVPPRVAATVLEQGSWIDDEVMAEYFGGILASSRTETGGDDRGAAWAQLVARMSRFQIRAHYLLYGAIRELALDTLAIERRTLLLDAEEKIEDLVACVPADVAVEVVDPPSASGEAVVIHALTGLRREGLIAGPIGFHPAGHQDHSTLPDWFPDHARGGLYAAGTFPGVELFLWAHGLGAIPPQAFLSPTTPITVDIPRLEEARITDSLVGSPVVSGG
jgi:hypothetical protein